MPSTTITPSTTYDSDGHKDRCALIGLLVAKALDLPDESPSFVVQYVESLQRSQNKFESMLLEPELTFEQYIPLAMRTECNQVLSVQRITWDQDCDGVCDKDKTNEVAATKPIRLLHCMIGMQADMTELWDALDSGDLTEVTEELGDMFWYLAQGLREFGVGEPVINIPISENISLPAQLQEVINGNFEYLERWLFYGQQLSVEFEDGLITAWHICAALCDQRGLNVSDVLKANIRKLKSRYPDKFDPDLAKESGRDRRAEADALKNTRRTIAEDGGVHALETPDEFVNRQTKVPQRALCHGCRQPLSDEIVKRLNNLTLYAESAYRCPGCNVGLDSTKVIYA